jgi:hypothetical protein
MKSVQTIFHYFKPSLYNPWPRSSQKKAKIPIAMGIAKFNLRFKVTCTWEQHKVVGGNVFFFQFCHVAKNGNHSKDNLLDLAIKKSEITFLKPPMFLAT